MSDPSFPERSTSDLTRRTLSGLSWMYLSTAIGAVLQFGMTAVMARLLTPAAFGLLAFAGLFLRFADYFAKAGITQALIQKPTLTMTDVRAATTLSVGLAAVFGGVVFVAAPLAGEVGQDPQVVPVLRWLVIGMLIHGLGSPSLALMRRTYRFKELAAIEVASYVGGYVVVGISMALAGMGVYALVGATLSQAAVAATARYIRVRHPLRPTWDRSAYGAILQFGARVSLVGFFEFLQTNLDTLAIGRWAGVTQLGLYNRANMLADLPAYHLIKGLGRVLLPSFSAIQHDHRRLEKAYLSAVGMTSAIILPLNAGIAVAGREIILVMLGPQWIGAIDVLPWLLLASSVALIGNTTGVVNEALAALNAKLVVAVCSASTLAVLLALAGGGPLWGYGAALAAAAVISHVGYLIVMSRAIHTSFWRLVRPYGPALPSALVVAAAIGTARLVLLQAGTATVVVLLAEIFVGALTLALMFRVGPLSGVRRDLAGRLDKLLGEGNGVLARTAGWLLGPAIKRSDDHPPEQS